MATHKNKILLETERLYLRPLEANDFECLCLLDMDPEVRSFFPEGVLTAEQVQKELDRHILEWDTLGFGIFAIVDKQNDRFIGRSGFAPLKSGEVEFGNLFLKECWGQGYATEAAKTLLPWGIQHIPVEYIIGFAPVAHKASIRVLQKCGMQYIRMGFYQNIPCVYYHYTAACVPSVMTTT